MIYGHDDLIPALGQPSRPAQKSEFASSWRALDSERRLAAIESALGLGRRAA